MLGYAVDGHDIRKVDFSRSSRRKLYFCLLGSLLESLQSHRILTEIHIVLLDKLVGKPVDNHVVEVITSEVGVTVGRFHLKHTVAKLQNRDIESTATEVKHSDFLILVALVKTVGQSGCGRLVDYTLHVETRDFTGLLRGLTLCVVEVSGHSDYSVGNRLTEIILGSLLHLLKNHGRNLLRSVLAAVDIDTRSIVVAAHHLIRHALDFALHLVVSLAHETLD